MQIVKKVRQYRRDFTAIYTCGMEGCKAEPFEGHGYDDDYFHSVVIPQMKCDTCGQASGVQTSTPDVPEGEVL